MEELVHGRDEAQLRGDEPGDGVVVLLFRQRQAEGVVQGGLLKSWTFTKTDETIAKLEAADAAAAALPETGVPVSGGLFPTYASVVALGGLVTLGSVGLALLRRRARGTRASGASDGR